MAKKDAKKEKKDKKASKNEGVSALHKQLLYLIIFVTGMLFVPTTLILIVGMSPTFAAALIDTSRRKLKTTTVGMLNFAGCSYPLLLLWTTEHSIDNALNIMLNSENLLIVLFSAAAGYMVDMAMTGLVSSVMVERGRGRIKAIKKRQEALVQRWGEEVTGRLPLDADGFPIKKDENEDIDL